MFSKILVGIDGSEYSRNAVNYALDLAVKYGSELFLLAIVPSKVHHGDSSGVFGMVSPSYFDEYKKEAEKWFEEIINHINKETTIDIRYWCQIRSNYHPIFNSSFNSKLCRRERRRLDSNRH